MAGEQAKSRSVGRVSDDDLPYVGVLGRTQNETVQVLMPDDSIRSFLVYTAVDAVSDSVLAAKARAGTLHHVSDGVELAIPFTYHDPIARVFLLVLPEGLRHRALQLRAELMLALSRDPHHAVPDYVRDVEIVVGPRGLARRLDAGRSRLAPVPGDGQPTVGRELADRERALARRERLIEARERALRAEYAARERALRAEASERGAVHESDVEELDEHDGDVYEPVLMDAELEPGEQAEEVSTGLEEVEELDGREVALEDGDEGVRARAPVDEAPVASPPDAFVVDAALQLWLAESNGRVWLFVRGRPGSRRGDGQMELLAQLDHALEPPVVIVSLVFDVEGSPEVRRGVIDPFVPEQRNALYVLAQHFEVELVSVAGHELTHFATLHSSREGNVRAVLAHLERYGELDRVRWEQARDAVLAAPPPWRDLTHPFQAGGSVEAPLTATEAAVLLDELSDWLAPERRARVQLALCVPDELVDATYRTGIGYALDWGLSLSRELAARALELGIEKDETALLARRIEGLCRTSREIDCGGLGPDVLRAEWSDALEQAARLGVSLSDDARETAHKYAGERALVHAEALADSRDASLDPVRERAHANPPDQAALEELVARGGYRDVLEACRLVHDLPSEGAGAVFAQMARRVDPIALDALLTLLSFSEPLRVRAGAALALAARRALNALDDLVSHVAGEEKSAYPLFALALGRYGAGSFRAVARALDKQGVAPERASLVFAHLALHGARAQVRAKARAREPNEAQLAERALALASEIKDGKKPALTLEQQGELTVLCEVFDRLCRDPVG